MTKCSSCKQKDAVFMRAYSGEKLCAKCFTKSVEDKIKATIAKHKMFKPDDRIAVAISGGKDSVTLLHVLAKFEKLFPEASLCAITVDEGIRGYRDEALRFAVDNCYSLGIEHFATSFEELFDVQFDELVNLLREKRRNKDHVLSPCAYCGVLRRRALNIAARQANADRLALAHNLDDEVQTILLNIMHGDAPRLARIKPVLGESYKTLVPRVKPLTEIPEKEVAFYAYLKKIQFQSVPCPYASGALRNDIRVMVNRLEEKHAGTKFTVFRSIERIRPALEAYEKSVVLRACNVCGELTVDEICKPCEMLGQLGVR
jgi:uncharacterized protein (TIGR00269 family)